SDTDLNDPPDNMAANFLWPFTVITDAAPAVTFTSPASGAVNVNASANLQVNFSEAITVSGNWFQIVCSNSGTRNVADTVVTPNGQTSFFINPTIDFLPGDVCTVTVFATQISDTDLNDPPDNMAANFLWTFTVAGGQRAR
ncbi:MAG: Ig-like domain-containing protein, partial [Casimicrobiaceae bacterium]